LLNHVSVKKKISILFSSSSLNSFVLVKPRINKVGLKSVTVKQGQTITLEAPYAAEPLPTMTWQRDTTVIFYLILLYLIVILRVLLGTYN
jgi:hypothetical protein